MLSSEHRLNYPQRGIASLTSLADTLRISESLLLELVNNSNKYYRLARRIVKEDLSERLTYDALPPLKATLTKLRTRVLDKVILPTYVTAGIRGKSYVDNAKLHAGSKAILSEDIKNFFPQVPIEHVKDAFKYVYKMPDDVALVAAKLCTMDGFLVQGSPVSGSIANVIFFSKEPQLAQQLENKGLRYSRYYDDVNISSKDNDFAQDVGAIRSLVYGMFKSIGLEPHQSPKKSKYAKAGDRMSIHGITVNNQDISPSKKRVSETRAMLFRMEKILAGSYSVDDVIQLYRSIRGKIQTLKIQGYKKAAELESRLASLVKLIDESLAKRFARGMRKVKNKKEFNNLASKLAVLKKISPRVNLVVKIESEQAKLRVTPQ